MFKSQNNNNVILTSYITFSKKQWCIKTNICQCLLNVFMQDYNEQSKVVCEFNEKINYLFSLNVYQLICSNYPFCYCNNGNSLFNDNDKKIRKIIKILEKCINNDFNINDKCCIDISNDFKQFINHIKNLTQCKKIKLSGIPLISHELILNTQDFFKKYKINLKDFLENENVVIFINSSYHNINYNTVNTVKYITIDDVIELINIQNDQLIFNCNYYHINRLDKLIYDIEFYVDGLINTENYHNFCLKLSKKIEEYKYKSFNT